MFFVEDPGALLCLPRRCMILTFQCSDDDLCMTCGKLALVARGYERQTLSFSGCIRTRLREVSIFEGCKIRHLSTSI
jgi:hypothetical protein